MRILLKHGANVDFSGFIGKFSDCEADAAESQVWLQIAAECKYLDRKPDRQFDIDDDEVIAMIVHMINNSDKRVIQ